MSILIDRLIINSQDTKAEVLPGRWFVSKPIMKKRSLSYRLKDAWKVLLGNHAYVYHYKEDEVRY